MTVQRDYPDFSNSGDTGEDLVDAIQPITDGEVASQAIFRRPSENLRARTETLRENMRTLNYHRDANVYALSTNGSTLLWAGTVASGGTGILTNTGAVTARPLLTPAVSTKGTLGVGVATSNEVIYTVPPDAYASDGVNNITVEHRDGGASAALTAEISAGPVKAILVVYDAANTAHDSAAVQVAVAAAIAADVGAGGLGVAPTKLTVADNGAGGTTIAALAETRLEGTADQEAHLIAAGVLTALTTTTPLIEGDCIALWYRHVVEPTSGDVTDPKVGLAGGRWESNPDRGTESVTNNLFITSGDPSKIPGAIPLCKVVENQLVWLDGSRFSAGHTSVFGMATDVGLDPANFAGANTVINNGGIPTTLASPQMQTAMDAIDDRLAALRIATYTCTDGTASVGGDYDGPAAVASAISALSGAGGTIFIRRGTYTLAGALYAIPDNVTLIGEAHDLVILNADDAVTLGARTQLRHLTLNGTATMLVSDDYGVLSDVTISGAVTLFASYWTLDNVSFTSIVNYSALISGAYNAVIGMRASSVCSLLGNRNTYAHLTVGSASGETVNPSLALGGTDNTFHNLTAEQRDVNFASSGDAVIVVSGSGHSVSGLYTDQSAGPLTLARVGLELNELTDTTFRKVTIVMGVGRPLSVGEVSATAPCTEVQFHSSTFRNDATSVDDYVMYVPVSDDHQVQYTDCEFDVSESTSHEIFGVFTSATSLQYFTYTRCVFRGATLSGTAGTFYSSSFTDCVFQIKNPVNGGVRQLGGIQSSQTAQIWTFSTPPATDVGCELHNCRFDMLDSEVELDGTVQPAHDVALIARFNNSRAYNTHVVAMNTHYYGRDGAGFFLLGGGSLIDGLEVDWTATAPVLAGINAHLSIINVVAATRNNQVRNIVWDFTSGGRYNGKTAMTAFFAIDNTLSLHVNNVKLISSGTRLLRAWSAGTETMDNCSFTDCQAGDLSNGQAAALELPSGSNNKFIRCMMYTESGAALVQLATSETYTDYSFLGCTFWQNGSNVITAEGIFDGDTSILVRAIFSGCLFYTDRTAGARVFSSDITHTECVGAGNIFKVNGGATATAPSFSASINSW